MTVEIVTDTSQEKAILETCIKSKAKQGESLQILEAGCGNKWQLSLTGIDYTLSGIDIDADAVALRQKKYNDLDDVLIGDLRRRADEQQPLAAVREAQLRAVRGDGRLRGLFGGNVRDGIGNARP